MGQQVPGGVIRVVLVARADSQQALTPENRLPMCALTVDRQPFRRQRVSRTYGGFRGSNRMTRADER